MSGLCRDCRWWVADPEDDLLWGDCLLHSSGEYREALREDYGADAVPSDIPPMKALASGGPGATFEYLMTAPDFGCVQFQEKTDAQ